MVREIRHVAAALGDKGAHEGGAIVLHFRLHHFIHLFAQQDGMGSTGVGSGRHGGDIGGFEDIEAGRRGTRAGRSDVNDDWNFRGQHFRDDAPGGVDESARSAQLDEHGFGVDLIGMRNGAIDEFLGDGIDRVVQFDANDLLSVQGQSAKK